MGAYSNPQEVLDTQTGQHFQNLQNTINQTVAGVASAYKVEAERKRKEDEENKKKLNDIVLNAEEESIKMYDDITKVSQAKQGVDFKEALNPLVEETYKINVALGSGASINRQDDVQKLADYRGAIDRIQGDIANISADTSGLYDKLKNAGSMGGLATDKDLNDADLVQGYIGLMGKLPATIKLSVDKDKPSQRTWKVTVGNTEKPLDFDGAQIQKIHDNNGEIFTMIPDTTDSMLKLIQDSGVYNIEMKQNSKGESTPIIGDIKQEYLGQIEKEPSKSKVPGKEINQLKQEVQIDKIKEKIFPTAKMQADGILSNPRQAQAWYNDIAVPALKLESKLKAIDFTDDARKDDFYKAYIDYAVLSIGEYQYVMNTPGDIATETIDTKPGKNNPPSNKKKTPGTNSKLPKTKEQLEAEAKALRQKLGKK